MKKLHFVYEMQIEYEIPVETCNFTIKCLPKDNLRQKITINEIFLYPNTNYNFGADGLLNNQIYGRNEMSHKDFTFRIEGDATTGFSEYDEALNEDLDMIFNHPHGLNIPGDEIKDFINENIDGDLKDTFEKVVYFMKLLHKYMQYEKFSTTVDTTANEAFKQRKGVCQDYAHIFIGMMHCIKVPARYVTGLIVGEGESHAWVEVLVNGKWRGVDPTNNIVVNDDYIKIGIGRDAKDCMINRGIMHGGGYHRQNIHVSVKES